MEMIQSILSQKLCYQEIKSISEIDIVVEKNVQPYRDRSGGRNREKPRSVLSHKKTVIRISPLLSIKPDAESPARPLRYLGLLLYPKMTICGLCRLQDVCGWL